MTSPSPAPTWRWPRVRLRPALALLVLFLAIGLSQGLAVWFSFLAYGRSIPGSRPFSWELTAAVGVWLALPIVHAAVLNAPGRRVGWARFLGLHAAGYLLFTAVHILWMYGTRQVLYALLGWGAYDAGLLRLSVPMEMARDLVTYAGAATLWTFIGAWRERQAEALRAAQLEGELQAAQLQALTGQLNPHFLFNALNTVSAVMYEDLPRTDRLLSDLGLLLRASLEQAGPTWTLAEERTHTQRFADVLTARFGERLRVRWDVAPGLETAAVPRFALQTLLENAVKHNQDRREPLEVRIRAHPAGTGWRLEVEDTGRGFTGASPASGPGVGLAQLERVLALLHGGRARLERGQSPEGGARVVLQLPGEAR